MAPASRSSPRDLGEDQLWVADRNGANARQLTWLARTSPLPDGRRMAGGLVYASRSRKGAELIVVDVDTSAARTIASDAPSIVAPVWSHDGRHGVYFGSRRSGDWQLWSADVDGVGLRAITTDGGYAAVESPGGASLYYTRLNRRGLWRRPADGDRDTLVSEAIEAEGWANVAIVDAGVFYVSRPDDGDRQLMRLDERTKQTRPLTRLPEFAWSGIAVSRMAGACSTRAPIAARRTSSA